MEKPTRNFEEGLKRWYIKDYESKRKRLKNYAALRLSSARANIYFVSVHERITLLTFYSAHDRLYFIASSTLNQTRLHTARKRWN